MFVLLCFSPELVIGTVSAVVVGAPSASAPLWFQLRAADRHRDRLTTLVRLAFVPSWKDVEAVSLPPKLSVLYYGVRPIRLGWRALAALR